MIHDPYHASEYKGSLLMKIITNVEEIKKPLEAFLDSSFEEDET